jgi:formate dehydrogenase
VAVDLVQRESHRHAHWLIPGEHFLERKEFNMLLVPFYDQPFAQYSHQVVEPPKTVQPVWKFWADLALALEISVFGKPAADVLTPQFHPELMVKEVVDTSGKITWDSLVNSPHGQIYGAREYGRFREHVLTPDKRIHAHIQDFANLLKQRLTEKPKPQSAAFPIQIVTRRLMGMMNSWLAETTGMSGTECSGDFIDMNTEDAASLGISDGQQVEVRSTVSSVRVVARVSDHVRSGVAIMEHGWGSRIFDPAGEKPPEVYGVNRNLLVANDDLDALASVPRLNGMPVQIVVV